MGVSFSVKNIPEAVAERLRLRAERNHRSLQRELMAILQAAALEDISLTPPVEKPGSRSVEDTLQRLRVIFPTPSRSAVSSTLLIRQMRDNRFGDAWTETGQQNGAT